MGLYGRHHSPRGVLREAEEIKPIPVTTVKNNAAKIILEKAGSTIDARTLKRGDMVDVYPDDTVFGLRCKVLKITDEGITFMHITAGDLFISRDRL